MPIAFADVRKDSCTDPQCFPGQDRRHGVEDASTKPQLVQISPLGTPEKALHWKEPLRGA